MPFFTPLLMASLFAFALYPYAEKWSRRKKVTRRVPAVLILFSLFFIVLVPISVVISRLIAKSKELTVGGLESNPMILSAENFLMDLSQRFNHFSEAWGIGNLAENTSGLPAKAATWILGLTTSIAAQLPEIILSIFIFLAALYYFLTEAKTIKKSILDFDLLAKGQLDQIIEVVQKSSYVTLITTLIIGSIQAVIVAVAAYFCGFNEFFLVFLLTFFMSLVPVIGAAPMAVLLSIFSFIQGDLGAGIALVITAVIAGSIDNILKPILFSSQDDMIHPVVSLIALIGAIIIYGFPGLLLGPVLTQLVFRIIPILFMKEETKEPLI